MMGNINFFILRKTQYSNRIVLLSFYKNINYNLQSSFKKQVAHYT